MPTPTRCGPIYPLSGIPLAVCLAGALLTGVGTLAADSPLLLSVSDSGRYLVDGEGKPFFWVGDTGWALLSSLTVEEAALYLDKRREQGFNVIQCILAHWDPGSERPSPDGHPPFLGGNPATPNPDYFTHVDRVLQLAADRDIILALLPAWGSFVIGSDAINPGNAREYGLWLGSRYADTPNIVWVLGGDQPPTGKEQVFHLLAEGLQAGDGGRHLLTYHPRGGGHSSGEFFHDAPWLSFNMIQSGHNIGYPEDRPVAADYARTPVRPTLVGEPRYENIIHGLRDSGPRIDGHESRKAAYQAVLSGAAGHTYGCNGVFQFYEPGGEERWRPRLTWEQCLDLPGARGMTHLRALMESCEWWKLQPDPGMIAEGLGEGGNQVVAARAADGTFALVYLPEYGEIAVKLEGIGGSGVTAAWFDPSTGESTQIGELPNSGTRRFLPPLGDLGPDSVLVMRTAGPDVTPPEITHVLAGGDPTRVLVRFSEPVDPVTAGTAANYTLTPGVSVTAAALDDVARTATLTTSALTDGETYTLTVADVLDQAPEPNRIADGTALQFTYVASPSRVVEGLLAFYVPAGAGDVIDDLSEAGEPLEMEIPQEADVIRAATGLIINGDTTLSTDGPAFRLTEACRKSNELTLEAWLKTADLNQTGPARILSMSLDSGQRNFTLGQDRDGLVVRLRTTQTTENGTPSTDTPRGVLTTDLTHVVFTRNALGLTRIYLNGEPVVDGQVDGTFANWADYPLLLANEGTGDRQWLGELRLVAVYSRALTEDQVKQNHDAGPGVGDVQG